MTQQKVASQLEIETPRPFNHLKARDASFAGTTLSEASRLLQGILK